MGTEAIWIPLVLAAAGGAVSYDNTQKTLKRQDAAAAESVRSQGRLQREADSKINEALGELERSDPGAAREERLGQFMDTLLRNRRSAQGDPAAAAVGGDAFRRSSAEAAARSDAEAARTAGLLATADSAILQREREGNRFGQLGTQLDLTRRRSQGQAFVDRLRANAIRRNAGKDLAAGLLSAGASAAAAGYGAQANPYGEVTRQVPLEPVEVVI